VLKLPAGAEGRRLRCPQCATRFRPGGSETELPSRPPGRGEAGPSSTILATPASSDADVPIVASTLRETFDLPLTHLDSGSARAPRAGDAAALFHEEAPLVRRRAGASARSQPRRCPACGGNVPVGMSLCSSCGLDIETGQRVEQEPIELDAPRRSSRAATAPLGVAMVGGGLVVVSGILAFIALAQWMQGRPIAALLCAPCLFGVYASIQFLRGKTVRLLLIALSLGALVDLGGLIALPVYQANAELPVVVPPANAEIDEAEVLIPSLIDRLDLRRITCGIIVLILYAAICLYLLSPGVRRFVRRA
jgi:hypothetical protein